MLGHGAVFSSLSALPCGDPSLGLVGCLKTGLLANKEIVFTAGSRSRRLTSPTASGVMADAIGRNEAATLGVAVTTHASKDPADGVDRLLGCVRVDGRDPAVCRTAIVGLERFFSERLCRGDLRVSLDPRDAKGARTRASDTSARARPGATTPASRRRGGRSCTR